MDTCTVFIIVYDRVLGHKRMELLPASQYVFINGVRAWTYKNMYMEQWSSSTTSHHCSHSA